MGDDINMLLREKRRWEQRILEIGGPNYLTLTRETNSHKELLGDEIVKGSRKYQYFGAARYLPGVKELFEKNMPRITRKQQLHQGVNADYYGFHDEEDGILLRDEARSEAKLRDLAIQDWMVNENKISRTASLTSIASTSMLNFRVGEQLVHFVANTSVFVDGKEEKKVLEKKTNELLDIYVSQTLQRQQKQTILLRQGM